MAKNLLAVVAALCALGAVCVSAQPLVAVRGHRLAHGKAHEVVRQEAKLRDSIADQILRKIEETLDAIQAKIESANEVVEDAVATTLQGIQDKAEQAAGVWEEQLQNLEDDTEQYDVDLSECLAGKDDLVFAEAAYVRAEAQQCIDEPVSDLREEMDNLVRLTPEVKAVLEDAKLRIELCRQEPFFFSTVCIMAVSPLVNLKVANFVAQSLYLSGSVSFKASTIAWKVNACTDQVLARHTRVVGELFDNAVECVQEKLSQTTTEAAPTEGPAPEPTPSEGPAPEPTPSEGPAPEPTPSEGPAPEPTPSEGPAPEPTPDSDVTPSA